MKPSKHTEMNSTNDCPSNEPSLAKRRRKAVPTLTHEEACAAINTLLPELVKTFNTRSLNLGYKGKTKVNLQAEFLLGACTVLDRMQTSQADGSCIPPSIFFSIMRGEEIKEEV